MVRLPLRDRDEAGRLLGAELARRNLPDDAIVLALPRGGIPIGLAVAKTLRVPLDVVVVRKLGVPWQPELAMGAIACGSVRVLDHELIRELRISRIELEAIIESEKAEIERREKLYRRDRLSPDLKGRAVLLVDDGLATGSTMVVAARSVRRSEPGRVIVAVPVASAHAREWLRTEADDCICLATPEPFIAVGQWYLDFPQVSDKQVQHLLEKGWRELGIRRTSAPKGVVLRSSE